MAYFSLFWKGRGAFLDLSREIGDPFWAYWDTFLSGQGSIQKDRSPILSLLGPIIQVVRRPVGAHFRGQF